MSPKHKPLLEFLGEDRNHQIAVVENYPSTPIELVVSSTTNFKISSDVSNLRYVTAYLPVLDPQLENLC